VINPRLPNRPADKVAEVLTWIGEQVKEGARLELLEKE
jgi:hypothetical protein